MSFYSCSLRQLRFAESFEGPLVIKNGQPLYAALNSPPLVSAEPENSLNIDLSYSSTYAVAGSNNWYVGIDLETALLDIQYKQVVGKGLEIGFDLPVIRYGSGFFDNEIETYHRLIGMPNAYGRRDRPQNDFLLEVAHNGKEVIHGKPSETALGDLMLEAKKNLYDSDSINGQCSDIPEPPDRRPGKQLWQREGQWGNRSPRE